MTLLFLGLLFMIIGFAVSSTLKSKFRKYAQIDLVSGLSGHEIAERMLRDHGIYDVKVVSVEGELSDHYNPANRTVNLSPDVYYGRSAVSAAVAAHECGHAVQHAKAYSFLELRSAMVPIQNVSATIINVVFIAMFFGSAFIGHVISTDIAILVIIGCYSIFTLFALITLPVEFDASNRALAWIERRGIVTRGEHDMAKDALKWAAMTYVVAAISSLATLFYWVMIFLNARDRE